MAGPHLNSRFPLLAAGRFQWFHAQQRARLRNIVDLIADTACPGSLCCRGHLETATSDVIIRILVPSFPIALRTSLDFAHQAVDPSNRISRVLAGVLAGQKVTLPLSEHSPPISFQVLLGEVQRQAKGPLNDLACLFITRKAWRPKHPRRRRRWGSSVNGLCREEKEAQGPLVLKRIQVIKQVGSGEASRPSGE